MLVQVEFGSRLSKGAVEVEEVGVGKEVEIAVAEVEVGLGSVLLVVRGGNGVQVGEVGGHIGRLPGVVVGHGRRRDDECRMRRRLLERSAPIHTLWSGRSRNERWPGLCFFCVWRLSGQAGRDRWTTKRRRWGEGDMRAVAAVVSVS